MFHLVYVSYCYSTPRLHSSTWNNWDDMHLMDTEIIEILAAKVGRVSLWVVYNVLWRVRIWSFLLDDWVFECNLEIVFDYGHTTSLCVVRVWCPRVLYIIEKPHIDGNDCYCCDETYDWKYFKSHCLFHLLCRLFRWSVYPSFLFL